MLRTNRRLELFTKFSGRLRIFSLLLEDFFGPQFSLFESILEKLTAKQNSMTLGEWGVEGPKTDGTYWGETKRVDC